MPRISSAAKLTLESTLHDESTLEVIIEEESHEVDPEIMSPQMSCVSENSDLRQVEQVQCNTTNLQAKSFDKMEFVEETVSSSSFSKFKGFNQCQEDDEEPEKDSILSLSALSSLMTESDGTKDSMNVDASVDHHHDKSDNTSPTASDNNDNGTTMAVASESSILCCSEEIDDDESIDSYVDPCDSKFKADLHLIDPTMLDSSSDGSQEEDYFCSSGGENSKDETSSNNSGDCLSYSTSSRTGIPDFDCLDNIISNLEILPKDKSSLEASPFHHYTSPLSTYHRLSNENLKLSIDYDGNGDTLDIGAAAATMFQESTVPGGLRYISPYRERDDNSMPPPPSLCDDDEVADDLEEEEESPRLNRELNQREKHIYLPDHLRSPSSSPKLSRELFPGNHNGNDNSNSRPESYLQLSPNLNVDTVSPQKSKDSSTVGTVSPTYCNSSSSCRSIDSFDYQSSCPTPDSNNSSSVPTNTYSPAPVYYYQRNPPNHQNITMNISNDHDNYDDNTKSPSSNYTNSSSALELLFPDMGDSPILEYQLNDNPNHSSQSHDCKDKKIPNHSEEEDEIVESFDSLILSCSRDFLTSGTGLGEDSLILLNILDCPSTKHHHKLKSHDKNKKRIKKSTSNRNVTKKHTHHSPNHNDPASSSPTMSIMKKESSRKNIKKSMWMKSLFKSQKSINGLMKNGDNDDAIYFKMGNKVHEYIHHNPSNNRMTMVMECWGNLIVRDTIEQMRSLQNNTMHLNTTTNATTLDENCSTIDFPLLSTPPTSTDKSSSLNPSNVMNSLQKSNSASSLTIGSLFLEENYKNNTAPLSNRRLTTLKEKVLSCLKEKNFNAAIDVLTQMLHLVLLNSGIALSDRFIGLLIYMRGSVHLIIGGSGSNNNYQNAVEDFEKAATIFKSLTSCDKEYMLTKLKLGISYYAREDFLLSLRSFEKALEIISSHPSKCSNYGLVLAEVINNIACIQYIIGNVTDSLNNFKKSISIQSSITKEGIYNNNNSAENTHLKKCYLFKYSITLCNLGFIQLIKKQFPSAVRSFESAVSYQQLFLQKENNYLLSAMEYLAMANVSVGQIENALKLYNCMLQVSIEKFEPLHQECALILSKINLINLSKSRRNNDLSFVENAIERLSKKEDARPLFRYLKVLVTCNFLRKDVVDGYY